VRDPEEMINLIDVYPEKARELKDRLFDWMIETENRNYPRLERPRR